MKKTKTLKDLLFQWLSDFPKGDKKIKKVFESALEAILVIMDHGEKLEKEFCKFKEREKGKERETEKENQQCETIEKEGSDKKSEDKEKKSRQDFEQRGRRLRSNKSQKSEETETEPKPLTNPEQKQKEKQSKKGKIDYGVGIESSKSERWKKKEKKEGTDTYKSTPNSPHLDYHHKASSSKFSPQVQKSHSAVERGFRSSEKTKNGVAIHSDSRQVADSRSSRGDERRKGEKRIVELAESASKVVRQLDLDFTGSGDKMNSPHVERFTQSPRKRSRSKSSSMLEDSNTAGKETNGKKTEQGKKTKGNRQTETCEKEPMSLHESKGKSPPKSGEVESKSGEREEKESHKAHKNMHFLTSSSSPNSRNASPRYGSHPSFRPPPSPCEPTPSLTATGGIPEELLSFDELFDGRGGWKVFFTLTTLVVGMLVLCT